MGPGRLFLIVKLPRIERGWNLPGRLVELSSTTRPRDHIAQIAVPKSLWKSQLG
jgi:hypothetical protein